MAKYTLSPFAAQNLPARAIYTDDNLPILRGFNSATVDLIYLDPPFNTGRGFPFPSGSKQKIAFHDTWKWTNEHEQHRYALGLDSAEAAAVVDTARLINGSSYGAYLVYMGVRLLEMRRILKPTGSIYFHCDPTMSHSVKLLMDCIFGRKNFRNEVIWRKYAGRKNNATRKFSTQHECLLFYAASPKALFRPLYEPHSEKEIERKYKYKDTDGRRFRLTWGRNYQLRREQKRIYLDESPGRALSSLWIEDGLQLNTSSAERTGYPTQKPLALLERIIKVSSDEGGLVLDPFCGCATTCVAAEMHNRRWIGIDLSKEAKRWVKKRLYETGVTAFTNRRKDPIEYPLRPARTDLPRTRINRGDLLPVLYRRQSGICNGCRRDVPMDLMEIDHIQPKARGGSDDMRNLQLLCGTCNTMKGVGTMEELFNKLARHESAERLALWRKHINQKIANARHPSN